MTEGHELSLLNRQQMNLTGVLSVDSFDEKEIWIDTKLGALILKGRDLHITHLDLTAGKMTVDGTINTMDYREDRGHRSGRSRRNIVDRLLK
ncbi:MAG: sporulation protein YabP [Syntrophomonadaceae bacterium]|nr:sporulation protein YabP [Syntrophomonadaceae bacterium]